MLVTDFDLADFQRGLADRCVQLLAVDAAGLMLAERRPDNRQIPRPERQPLTRAPCRTRMWP